MTDFKVLYEEYSPTEFDDDQMLLIKKRIMELDVPSRNIFLLYCETGSFAGVGRILHSSPPTVKRKITEIKRRLLKNYG